LEADKPFGVVNGETAHFFAKKDVACVEENAEKNRENK